jgi:hypothetical protein
VLASIDVAMGPGARLSASGGVGGAGSGGAGGGGNGGGGVATIYSESLTGSNFVTLTQGAGLQLKDYGALTLTVTRSGAGTVTSSPAGISCGADCTQLYDGQTVTLTATPEPGSTFSGWSGDCTNATGDCVVQMTADRSVAATFVPVSEPPTEQPPTTTTEQPPTTTTEDPPTTTGEQPPTSPLALELAAARKQPVEKLRATATCSRDCTVSMQARGRAGEKFTSRTAVADLAAGEPTAVRLTLKRSELKEITGRSGTAKVAAVATDASGGQAAATIEIKLKS